MIRQRPTILIVHGAWHTPEHYERLVQMFHAAGYDAVCPPLPTCNDANPPNKTFLDDTTQIRNVAEGLRRDRKRVIAVCHSYGGVVATEALRGVSIERIVYMSAFIPMRGEGLAGIMGGKLPPWIISKEDGTLGVRDPAFHFYNDVQEPKSWIKRLVTHPSSAQHDPVHNEAWRSAPVSYIVCEKDQALPPAIQMMMVGRVQQEGVEVEVEICPASHSPFLSMPEKIVEIVSRLAS